MTAWPVLTVSAVLDSGKHLALLSLVLHNAGQRGRDGFDGFGSFGHDGYPP